MCKKSVLAAENHEPALNVLADTSSADRLQAVRSDDIRSLPCHSSVPAALARLRLYLTFPRTVPDAIELFYRRFDHGILFYLYRRFFPDEYAASEESEEIDPGWSYSPREVDFLYLVNDRLFPLDLDFISEAGANGDRATETIYLISYDMPWWYEAFERLSPGWQVFRLLSGTMTGDDIEHSMMTMAWLPSSIKDCLLQSSLAMTQAQPSLLKRVRKHFARQGSFSSFGDVLALYQYQTGNPWLDTNSETEILYEGACWCEKHMKEIAQTYQAAHTYVQQVNTFASWLEEDSHRICQLITIIKQVVPSVRSQSGDTWEETAR